MPIDYGTNNVTSSGNVNVSGIVTATSGVFTNLTFNGTVVSISGHTHTASSITDFNEAVDDRIGSGLFVAGTGINLNYNDSSNTFTVSVTGVSFSGHTHTSSNITDFNSSVSGLLPVKNITAGSGISVSVSSGNYTINTDIIDCGIIGTGYVPPPVATINSYVYENETIYNWN
jgi:hypothetical protein